MGAKKTNRSLVMEVIGRLARPLVGVGFVFLFGTFGFFFIGHGRWSLFDCAYMTSITVTTVGYGETLVNMGQSARLFAMFLVWAGMGVALYAVSAITAFFVENNFSQLIRERRMDKQIASLSGHIIVCGLGSTGLNILEELTTTGRRAVAIDRDAERAEAARRRFPGLPVIVGDAAQEEVLERAGIGRAFGIVAHLPEDSQNMLITVQARYISPTIKIVAQSTTDGLVDKFYRAGADYVVNPALIGGLRMASVLIRPHVVTFLDRMLRGDDPTVRVAELTVREGSDLIGQTLGQAELGRRTGLRPIAVSPDDGQKFIYNPPPDLELRAGAVLIVIGNPGQIDSLAALCR